MAGLSRSVSVRLPSTGDTFLSTAISAKSAETCTKGFGIDSAEEAGGNYMCRTNGVLTASRHECSHSIIDSFSAIISDLHSRLGT